MNTIKKWTRKLIALALAIISTVTLVIPMRAQAAEYIKEDEYVEVTPNHLRIRKIILDELERKRANKV